MNNGAGAIILILIAAVIIWVGVNPNLPAVFKTGGQNVVTPQTALDILQEKFNATNPIRNNGSGASRGF